MKPTFKYDHKAGSIREAMGIPISHDEFAEKMASIAADEKWEMRSEMLTNVIKECGSVEEAVAMTWIIATQRAKFILEEAIEDIMG